MTKNKIYIRPAPSLEGVLSLAPALAALKTLHPEAELAIVADASLREGIALLPHATYFGPTIPADGEIYDFSHSAGDSWGQESAEWKSYFQACAQLGTNPYHQIDLMRKISGADGVDVNFELLPPGAENTMPESITGGTALRIALCASSLGINELQSALEGISRLNCEVAVHLTGTISDRRKSAVLLSAWDGRLTIVDLCGRQNFSEWAETLRLCDIAIVAPGVSALLSSGYGTFTVCVDDARKPLNYPYGHGHLIIQQTESAEFFSALSGLISEIINFALTGNGGSIPSLDQWQASADALMDNFLSHLRLFATQRIELRQTNDQSLTELYLRPLIFLGAEHEDILKAFNRLLWENALSGRELSANGLEILHQDSMARLREDLKPLEQFFEIANFGRTYSQYIHSSLTKSDQEQAQRDATKLQETEELVHALANSHATLRPLAAFHEKRQRLWPESEALPMAKQMEQQFTDMQARVLVLLDLTQTLFHTTLQNEALVASEEGSPNG